MCQHAILLPLRCSYLVEAPPNICTPGHLADTAKYLADKFPDVFSLRVSQEYR